MKITIVLILCLCGRLINAQIGGTLQALTTEQTGDVSSKIDGKTYNWGCVANFKLPGGDYNNVKFIETSNDRIYVVDDDGILYCFNADFSLKWKTELHSEHLANFRVSPDNRTLAFAYIMSRAKTRTLEIRSGSDGAVLHRIKRYPDCNQNYLDDLTDKTTYLPYQMSYSKDGNKLFVIFENDGISRSKDVCRSSLSSQAVLLNPNTGKILATRDNLPKDFEASKFGGWCSNRYPSVFSADGRYLYIPNCRASVVKYDATTLRPVKVAHFHDEVSRILNQDLNQDLLREMFDFEQIAIQQNGELLTGYGGQGEGFIFKIAFDLNSISYVTTNNGTNKGRTLFSPDWTMAMFNADNYSLWHMGKRKCVLFDGISEHGADIVRFHPTKKAIMLGGRGEVKIYSTLKKSEVSIRSSLTPTGHYYNAETTIGLFGSSGKLKIAYDKDELYSAYDVGELAPSSVGGHRNFANSESNLPRSMQLYLKSDSPGTYTIIGGTSSPMTNKDVLQNLGNWR